jgi:hypothetical protein
MLVSPVPCGCHTVRDCAGAGLHCRRRTVFVVRVKVLKQQINGGDRTVLKENATPDDLKSEAMRLKSKLGYQVQHDKRRGTYTVSHPFYQGKFVLLLAPD